ncbi:MAG: T9SS type A sorting domain-containing protein, partial [Ignavibacteriae bacterium]|nr:T9SS type A sorting domain-containing protein [Ignavibacteriota bacterium]
VNYVVGSGGLILKSSDFGASWQVLSSNTNSTLRSAEFSVNNTSHIYAVGDNGTILKTTDGGESWGRQESPTRANLRSVFFYLNDKVGFACGDSGVILRTTDGGGGFVPVADSLEDMFPLSVGNQWEYNYSWVYDDYLSSIRTSLVGTARLRVLGATHTTDSTRWLLEEHVEGTFCLLYYWPPMYDTCYPTVRTTAFDLIERHDWRHRLYRNSYHYDCWNSVVPFGRDLVEPSFIYRYAYPDSGSTTRIRPRDHPLYPSILYNVLMKADSGLATIESQTGYLVGSSFQSNHRLVTGTIVDIPDEKLGESPGGYKLFQNYPNPFNPKTSFQFSVPSLEFVSLRVYDVLGREVATLVNEVKQPGTYELTWNAEGLSSGVYLYRLQAGSLVQTKKLVLLR